MGQLTRRQFTWVLGSGLIVAGGGHRRRAQSQAGGPQFEVTTRGMRALGTQVSLTVHHPSVTAAERAISAALAAIERVEAEMSLYRPDSMLCRLNRDGCIDDPSSAFVEVLQAAHDMSARTSGAFDVTVQPLWKLHNETGREGRSPMSDELAAVHGRVNWRWLTIAQRRIAFERPGMAATLNGIAQGYATDCAAAALREHGVEHALIDAGELSPRGSRGDGVPWRVGIQHPRRSDACLAITELDGRCLATSGDYAIGSEGERAVRGDKHIIDPATGHPPGRFTSVSVLAPTATLADALSTSLFVLDVQAGLQLIARSQGVDALFVLPDGSTVRTDGFLLASAEVEA